MLGVYDPRDLMLQTYVLKQFIGLKMSEGDTVDKHILDFRNCLAKMISAGFKLEEELLAVILLTTLPDSWSGVVHSLQEVHPLSTNRVIGAMLTEESRKRISAQTLGGEKALYLNKPGRGRGHGKPSIRGRGRGRGIPFRPSTAAGSKSRNPCGYCGIPNHTWEVCRKRLAAEGGTQHSGHLAVTMNKYSKAFLTQVVQRPPATTQQPATSAPNPSCNVVTCFANQEAHIWYIDSGASQHMTPHSAYFTELTPSTPEKFVCLGDNTQHKIEGQGTIRLDLKPAQHLEIPDVLYVPGLAKNLVSARKIDQSGCFVCFGGGKCVVETKEGSLLATGHLQDDDLYHLDLQNPQAYTSASPAHYVQPSSTYLWHLRLGHINFRKLVQMHKDKLVEGLTLDVLKDFGVCPSCILGKHKRTAFPTDGATRATDILGLVHTDICGPLPKSIGGKTYFLTFIDDFTRFCVVYFLRYKSETFACFVEYKAWAKRQTGRYRKILRSDNGGEYLSGEFIAFCKTHGIARQLTNPHTPQQNVVSEHKNWSLETSASNMLQYASLPKSYWAEAVAYATYIQNRIPHKAVIGKTPYELWTGLKPDISNMRVFGSPAFARVPKDLRTKFDPKSTLCIFIGFSDGIKGFKLLSRKTRKVMHSRDVVFVEGVEANLSVGATSACSSSDDDSTSDAEEFLVGDVVVPLPAAAPIPNAAPIPAVQPPARAAGATVPPRPPVQSPRVPTPLKTPGRPISNRGLYESPSTFGSPQHFGDLDAEVHPPAEVAVSSATLQSRRQHKHGHLAPREPYPSRHHRPPDLYEPADFRRPKSNFTYCLAATATLYEPPTYEEALSCPDSAHWQQAIYSERISERE